MNEAYHHHLSLNRVHDYGLGTFNFFSLQPCHIITYAIFQALIPPVIPISLFRPSIMKSISAGSTSISFKIQFDTKISDRL